jgi:hypothetical protein
MRMNRSAASQAIGQMDRQGLVSLLPEAGAVLAGDGGVQS